VQVVRHGLLLQSDIEKCSVPVITILCGAHFIAEFNYLAVLSWQIKTLIKYLAVLIFLSLFLNNYASDVVAVKVLVSFVMC
jgi:hypothetical protein